MIELRSDEERIYVGAGINTKKGHFRLNYRGG